MTLFNPSNFISLYFLSYIQRKNLQEALEIHPKLNPEAFKDAEFIIMPLFKNSHWLFSAIDPQRGIIYIGDSLKWYGNDFIEEFKNLESAITKFIYGNKEKNGNIEIFQMSCQHKLMLFLVDLLLALMLTYW